MARSYGDSESEMESDHLLEAGKQRSSSMSAKAQLRVQAVVVCTLYAIVGPSLVLVNNHILKSLNFPFPLFLSALGLITTSCVCFFIIRVLPWIRQLKNDGRHPPPTRAAPPVDDVIAPSADGRRLSDDASSQIQPSHLPNGGVSLQFWLRNMVPIGAAQGLTFASTNAAYMYLTITFTQVRDDALECAARERPAPCLPTVPLLPPLACHRVRGRAVTHTRAPNPNPSPLACHRVRGRAVTHARMCSGRMGECVTHTRAHSTHDLTTSLTHALAVSAASDARRVHADRDACAALSLRR